MQTLAEQASRTVSPTPLALLFCRNYGDALFAAALALELDHSVAEREESPVFARSDILAWVHFGAALAYQYAPGANRLTASALYAAILWVRVATVAGRALSFFMCHDKPLMRVVLLRERRPRRS